MTSHSMNIAYKGYHHSRVQFGNDNESDAKQKALLIQRALQNYFDDAPNWSFDFESSTTSGTTQKML